MNTIEDNQFPPVLQPYPQCEAEEEPLEWWEPADAAETAEGGFAPEYSAPFDPAAIECFDPFAIALARTPLDQLRNDAVLGRLGVFEAESSLQAFLSSPATVPIEEDVNAAAAIDAYVQVFELLYYLENDNADLPGLAERIQALREAISDRLVARAGQTERGRALISAINEEISGIGMAPIVVPPIEVAARVTSPENESQPEPPPAAPEDEEEEETVPKEPAQEESKEDTEGAAAPAYSGYSPPAPGGTTSTARHEDSSGLIIKEETPLEQSLQQLFSRQIYKVSELVFQSALRRLRELSDAARRLPWWPV
ncbi:MAG: hypothetical protein PHH60_00555 [Candidatus Margulisbacteria bacterium]|nr:hypothetical protein [Candidatus Margulisiibacteriota bacterium]